MKIETMCAECRNYKSRAVAEVTDDESLKFICPRGHTFKAVLRTPLYVPIFENSLRAYADEEYYECSYELRKIQKHSYQSLLLVNK